MKLKELVEDMQPGNIFDTTNAEQVAQQFKNEINAPYVSTQISRLGGPENVAIMMTISLDSKMMWHNGILQNSRYMMYHISSNGVIDQHNKSYLVKDRFRKVRVKSVTDAIDRINQYTASQMTEG